MWSTNIVIGIVLAVLLVGAVSRHRFRDAFAVLLVLGIAAVAVAVTVSQINQYREEKTTIASAAAQAPAANPPELPRPPRALPDGLSPPPVMRGPTGATGAAAPPAIDHRYAGEAR